MRLSKYILEDRDFSVRDEDTIANMYEVLSEVWSKCKPYIKLLSDTDKIMYSGRRTYKGDYFIGDVRKNRKPLTTYIELHNDLDEAFYRKFKVKARSNSLFCTGSIYDAEEYGIPYIIFPIGNFKYVWSNEIGDLYLKISRTVMSKDISRINGVKEYIAEHTPFEDVEKEYKKFISNLIDKYTDTHLTEALDYEHEIMVIGKKYYALKMDERAISFIQKNYGTEMPDFETFEKHMKNIWGI